MIALVLCAAAVLVVSLVATIIVLRQQALTRDAIRIADMARLESAFATLSFETSSYASAAAGCAEPGSLVHTCSLGRQLPVISTVQDPGKHSYVVTMVPNDTTFAVAFTLERGFALYGQGEHVLTPDGIQ